MKRLFKVSTMSTVAVVAFVINPLWITSCEKKPVVAFTKAEMLAELTEAVGTHTMESEDGVLTLELEIDGLDASTETKSAALAPSFVQAASACGHHEQAFVVGASACLDTYHTMMRFKGRVVATWAPKEGVSVTFNGPIESTYSVLSKNLVMGKIEFETSFEEGPTLDVGLFTEDGNGENFKVEAFKLKLSDETVEGGNRELLERLYF